MSNQELAEKLQVILTEIVIQLKVVDISMPENWADNMLKEIEGLSNEN